MNDLIGLNPSDNPEDQDKENLIKAKLDLIKQETKGQLLDIHLTGCFDHTKWWAVRYREPSPNIWVIRVWENRHDPTIQRNDNKSAQDLPIF